MLACWAEDLYAFIINALRVAILGSTTLGVASTVDLLYTFFNPRYGRLISPIRQVPAAHNMKIIRQQLVIRMGIYEQKPL